MLAFMPFTVNLEKYRVTLERNEAHAIAPVFAGAAAFLGEVATAAGFASTGELVATLVGIGAIGAGMNLANETGVYYGDRAVNNINNLVQAENYPDWNTLSSSEKESWGSEVNYNSAKLNSLMGVYGLDDAYNRYQQSWGGGGSGQFSFSSSETSILSSIGDVGSNWSQGLANTFEDVAGLISNDAEQAYKDYYGIKNSKIVDLSQVSGYPSNYPSSVVVELTDHPYVKLTQGNSSTGVGITTNFPTYTINFYKTISNGGKEYALTSFWTSSFRYNTGTSHSSSFPASASSTNMNGNTFYYYTNSSSYGPVYNDYTLDTNVTLQNYDYSSEIEMRNIAYYLLFGGAADLSTIGEVEKNLEDYPEQTPDNATELYFPGTGLNENTNWDELLTYQEEITQDLSGIITLLQKIDSDINSGFGRFVFNNDGYLLVKDPDIYNALTTFFAKFHFNSDSELLVHDLKVYNLLNSFVNSFNTWKSLFSFYNTGELKVHDIGVFNELSDIYSLLMEISGKMSNWGDIADAPEIIGDFDFDELENKVPDLLDTISDLAPFGSILLLSEMYSILANYTQIESPELVFPFDFGGFDEQNHELIIDLSWLDDIKPLINFFCIALLIIAIANATIRIVEIEAAS